MLAPPEKANQSRGVRLIGTQVDGVEPEPAKQLGGAGLFGLQCARVSLPDRGAAGIDRSPAASLRVTHFNEADVWQGQFRGIRDSNRHDIMPKGGHRERPLSVWHGAKPGEVRKQEDDRPGGENPPGVSQGSGEIGAVPRRRKGEQIPDETQRVAAALPWRDGGLDPVGEDGESDAVVVSGGGQGQRCGDLGDQFGLEPDPAAETEGAGLVHGEQDGKLPLFYIRFDVRNTGTRGDIPVDAADLIAGEVFPNLGKLEALAAKDRRVLPAEPGIDQAARAKFDAPDLPENVPGRRRVQGTRTTSKTRRTTSSGENSSASASYVVTTRCRSTSAPIAFTSSGST